MNLIIVESPTKAKTLSRFLGKEYKVLATMGHVRDLPKGELGVDIENNFKPKYVIPTKARKTISALKKEAGKSKKTILATDEDREGEAIAWHLKEVLGLEKPERIVFHEITKEAINEALKSPRQIDMNLVDAQQARRILDRIVGYKLSPFLWKKITKGLSAGRVQSVAVKLVVEREREIQKFKPQEYWTVEARLQSRETNAKLECKTDAKNDFLALLVKKDEKVIPKLGIKTKEEVDEIVENLKDAEYKIESIEKKEIKKNPLPPFTTSTLQQEAWKRFHYPAKFTMAIAQKLYETGYISYHRTDSVNLSDFSLFAAKNFIEENFGKNYWAGFLRKYQTRGRAQEAHEAIRPSYPDKTPEALKTGIDKNSFKLYDLIWRRFIACQMAQASFDSTIVEIETGNSKFAGREADSPEGCIRNSKQIQNSKSQIPKYIFRASGQIMKFDGFLKVYPMKFTENELPELNKNEILELLKLIPSQHFTEPLARYNEASLIKALEENGIGRPSTYAPTLSTIQARNYIEKNEQKRFKPTEIGTVVNDLLVEHFPEVVDIDFTAKMEKELDEVAEGKDSLVKTCRDFYTPFAKNLKEKYEEVSKKDITDKPTDKICPKCGTPLVERLGRFGRFYACPKFPECKYAQSIEGDADILDIKCPKCLKGKITGKRTKKGKTFYGCDRFPECDFALWDRPTKHPDGEAKRCPQCNSLLVEKSKMIKCSNRECGFKEENA